MYKTTKCVARHEGSSINDVADPPLLIVTHFLLWPDRDVIYGRPLGLNLVGHSIFCSSCWCAIKIVSQTASLLHEHNKRVTKSRIEKSEKNMTFKIMLYFFHRKVKFFHFSIFYSKLWIWEILNSKFKHIWYLILFKQICQNAYQTEPTIRNILINTWYTVYTGV